MEETFLAWSPMCASMPEKAAVCGIDLGGTKIETGLFDAGLLSLASRQIPTPQSSYGDLLSAIAGEIAWAIDQAGVAELPVGIGQPGLIDPRSGRALTANLPATGKRLAQDVAQRTGQPVTVENDCKCFALSEANAGAGAGHHTVMGLILGTGLGGGVCIEGTLSVGRNRVAGEVGHFALPATLAQRFNLPIIACGCGQRGCFETYLSGRGLTRLDEHVHGRLRRAPELAEARAEDVFAIWYGLLGELLHTIQLTLDPDCIVLGGGLSNLPGIETRAAAALAKRALPGLAAPEIRVARFGTSSGVRGAAMLALHDHDERSATHA